MIWRSTGEVKLYLYIGRTCAKRIMESRLVAFISDSCWVWIQEANKCSDMSQLELYKGQYVS